MASITETAIQTDRDIAKPLLAAFIKQTAANMEAEVMAILAPRVKEICNKAAAELQASMELSRHWDSQMTKVAITVMHLENGKKP